MKEIQKSLRLLTEEFYQIIDEHNVKKPRANNWFNVVVTASFIKQLEFLKQINLETNKSNIFFFMPVMRGLCEDLITLKFIKEKFPRDKHKIIKLLMNQENYTRLRSQSDFFKKYKSNQMVLSHKLYSSYKQIRSGLSDILKRNGINSNKLPPVEKMAKEIDMVDIYNYLYTASTDLVHFRVGTLLKMGWSATQNSKNTFRFSTKNFYIYYDYFLCFYSTFLFVEFTKTFKSILDIKNRKWEIIKELDSSILNCYKYPELVTYEELNLKRPSPIVEALMRVSKEK